MAELMHGAWFACSLRPAACYSTSRPRRSNPPRRGSPCMTQGPIDRLMELANANAWLVHRGRFVEVTFLIEIGAAPAVVGIPSRSGRNHRQRSARHAPLDLCAEGIRGGVGEL